MKVNEKELLTFTEGPADKEGRMHHCIPGGRYDVYKERWFKLKGNLLFYYRINDVGSITVQDGPLGVIVLENFRIDPVTIDFGFQLIFNPDEVHKFSCTTQRHCDEWMSKLTTASYEYQRHRLKELRSEILARTGKDPLEGRPLLGHALAEPASKEVKSRSVWH